MLGEKVGVKLPSGNFQISFSIVFKFPNFENDPNIHSDE